MDKKNLTMKILYTNIICQLIVKINYYSINSLTAIIIIIFIFAGCGSNNDNLGENTILFSKFPKVDSVYFNNICEYKQGVAGMLELVDSTLIIFNVSLNSKYFLCNYSLKNGQFSNEYIGKGRGPGEAIGAIGIGINGNSLWLHDISLNKILIIDKSKAIAYDSTIYFKEYPVKENYYMIGFNDSLHYFGVGNNNSAFKIQEIDLISGKEINQYGEYKNISPNIPLVSFKSAHESFIYIKPKGNKIVLPYRYLDAVEIFNINTQKSVIIHGPEGFDVMFNPLPNGMERTDKTRFAFVNGTITNKYIYLSYSGLLCNSENSYYGSKVYVYDWDGNPIRKLILNKQILGIAISEDDKTMYAYDVNTGFIIQSNIN